MLAMKDDPADFWMGFVIGATFAAMLMMLYVGWRAIELGAL